MRLPGLPDRLHLSLLSFLHVANRLNLALCDLTKLVDTRVVDAVDVALELSATFRGEALPKNVSHLVQQNDEDDIVPEASQTMEPRHPDTKGKEVVDDGSDCPSAFAWTLLRC